jgi:undecaprenyl-diphosphatase
VTSSLQSWYKANRPTAIYSSRILQLSKISFIGAILLTVSVLFYHRLPGDLPAIRIIQSLSMPFLDDLMGWISLLGTTFFVVVSIFATATVFIIWKRKKEAFILALILIPEGMVVLLKEIIGRPRPTEDLVRVIEISGTGSFPSGHTFHMLMMMGLLIFFLLEGITNRWLARGIITIFSSLILLTAISRLYLGAHWPSDIVGSMLFAIPTLLFLHWIYISLGKHFRFFKKGATS